MNTKRKTTALKTGCLFLLMLLLAFALVFASACGDSESETPSNTPPATEDNIGKPDDDLPAAPEQPEIPPETEDPDIENPNPDIPDGEQPKPEEPEQPEQPAAHKFAGSWLGWIMDFTAYEYKIVINDDGEITSESFFCRFDEETETFVYEEIAEFSIENDSVNVKSETTENVKFDYNENDGTFTYNSEDHAVTLTKENIISLEDFYADVSGDYIGEDGTYSYECTITAEFGFMDCAMECYAGVQPALTLFNVYTINGTIVLQLTENDELYYATFDSDNAAIVFIVAPSGANNALLQKVTTSL